MVRALENISEKFHNRRAWRDVAAAVQASVAVPDLVEALRAGVRRLREVETVPPVAGAAG